MAAPEPTCDRTCAIVHSDGYPGAEQVLQREILDEGTESPRRRCEGRKTVPERRPTRKLSDRHAGTPLVGAVRTAMRPAPPRIGARVRAAFMSS